MTYQVIVRPLAERDLLDASAWYEERKLGLGSGVRRAILRRFPHLVHFVVHGETVRVTACLHAARAPGVIRRRLRKA